MRPWLTTHQFCAIGLYLTDITFCREGNPSHRASPKNPDKKLLNFNKYHKLARIVQDMQRFQVPYNIKEIPEIQEYLKFAFEESSKRSGDIQDLYRRRYVKLHSGVHSFMLIPVLASWSNPVDLQTYHPQVTSANCSGGRHAHNNRHPFPLHSTGKYSPMVRYWTLCIFRSTSPLFS